MPRHCSHGACKRGVARRCDDSITQRTFQKDTKWEKRASRLTGGSRFYIQSAGTTALSCQPNLLVCLKPYSVLTQIGTEGGRWQGARGQPLAKWNGNSIVAIWVAARWGMEDLAIYEIEADEIKQIQPVWRQVRILFDRDFRERFLSKYPDEKGSGVIFVSKGEGPDSKPEFEFKGRKMLLNLFADNKPNLSVTPHWTASLHAVWNLDTAEFDKVDFQPGPIELRPEE